MKYQRHLQALLAPEYKLEQCVRDCLVRAERDWTQVRERLLDTACQPEPTPDVHGQPASPPLFENLSRTSGSVERETYLPPWYFKNDLVTLRDSSDVSHGRSAGVGEFVALMADMRVSSSHFDQPLPADSPLECGLQRILYETAALLPAITVAVAQHGGQTIELLGDGVLVLFGLHPEDRAETIRRANLAAHECIGPVMDLVNRLLFERYGLPAIQIGIGLAAGKAIVHRAGVGDAQLNVLGRCIWEAANLSDGHNTVRVTDSIRLALMESPPPTLGATA